MGFIERWARAVNSAEARQVVELYRDDAVLWGTFSRQRRQGHDAIMGYFKDLCAKDEVGVKFGEWSRVEIGSATVYSGFYRFSYRQRGDMQVFRARFTFVTTGSGAAERAVEHHSSLVPA